MQKRKYSILRKANKSPNFPNYVPYAYLAKYIRSIEIGRIHNINPSLSYNLPKTEMVDECAGNGQSLHYNLQGFI